MAAFFLIGLGIGREEGKDKAIILPLHTFSIEFHLVEETVITHIATAVSSNAALINQSHQSVKCQLIERILVESSDISICDTTSHTIVV